MLDAADPKTVTGVILAGAALVRVLLALLRTPALGGVLERVPKDLRPFVPLALSAGLALLEQLASGGGVLHGVTVALGAFAGSEVTYRVQRGRAKRLAAGASLSLEDG